MCQIWPRTVPVPIGCPAWEAAMSALELSRFIQMPGVVDSFTLVAMAKLTSRPWSSPKLLYVAISLRGCRQS